MVGFLSGTISEEKEKYLEPKIIPKTDGFSKAAFVEAVKSIEEPTPEEAKEAREGLLEASTFLPGVGGVIDVGKSTVDFLGGRGGLANIGIAAASFLPGGKIATTALRQGKALTKTAREELRKKYELPKSQRQKRVPEVQQAAEDLYNKKITKAEYDNIVRDKQPIVPIKEMPEVPDLDRIEAVLDESKVKTGIVGKTLDGSSLQGKRVASRLDIPAYDNYDTWVVSLHDGTKRNGIAIGYGQSAVLKNVDFHSYEKASLNIARGKSKATIARIYGDYDDVPVETVYNKVKKELTNPNSEYVQVGMNPFRHSYFYDKAKGTPILKADEILQIGPLVLAKTPIYGKAADFSFKEGGMINMENGGMLGGDLPPEAIANGNVIQGAPVGEVDVPGGGGPVDDGVPTELPEGTFVLNAASVEYHGTKNINDLIKNAIRELIKEGVEISGEDINPDDDVPVAISNGEYIIPPEVAKKIGIKKLEDMNERGLEYRKKQEEVEKQKVAEEQQAAEEQQVTESFMAPPMLQQEAPIQSEQQAMAMADTPPMMNKGGSVKMPKGKLANLMSFLGDIIEEEQQNIQNPEASDAIQLTEATPLNPILRRISPENLPFGSRPKPKDVGEDPSKPVPMTFAQTGGTIDRDPQSSFLAPQVARQAQGLQTGANTFPTSPQESFIGTPITGSVLENISNAVPQSLQPTGFVQPNSQKKNSDELRLGYVDGKTVKPQFKPFRFMSPNYIARLLQGEDTTGQDHQKIIDTIINRTNADKDPEVRVGLRDEMLNQNEFEGIYSTFKDHKVDPISGDLVNKKDGTLVARRESITSLSDYVKKALTSPSKSDVTHYVTKKLYNSPEAPAWTKSNLMVTPKYQNYILETNEYTNEGLIPYNESKNHIFFKEITDRALVKRKTSVRPLEKPNIMEEAKPLNTVPKELPPVSEDTNKKSFFGRVFDKLKSEKD